MKDRMREKFKDIDLYFVTKTVYYIFFIAVFIITVWICIESPVQHHFKNIRKNDVWFGDDWYDTSTGDSILAVSQHYLRIHTDDGHVSITKTLDFTPSL